MSNLHDSYRKDELTLGEVIHWGGVYLRPIKKYFGYIIGFTLFCAALSFYYYSNQPTLYKARLSFMLNEDESSQMTSMNTILGQLGFPIINQRVNISKVLELSLSRKIVQDAIFNKIKTENGLDYLANHIISEYELADKWAKNNKEMAGFTFDHSQIDSFDQKENIALRSLSVMIAGTPANRKNALIETDYGQNTTIMSYVTHSIDELISYHLTNSIFESTSNFYVEKTIEKQQATYDVLTSKKDSLIKIYDNLENQYAIMSDRSTGLFSSKMDIKKDRIRAEMLQMSSGLAKLEENIALVEFGIENNTPILQTIDAPILPLEEVSTSKLKSILIGAIVGFILSAGCLILITFWKNITIIKS